MSALFSCVRQPHAAAAASPGHSVSELDVATLAGREAAHAWLPARFGHLEGDECAAAELRTDTQLKG
ncbi:hypothetical protein GCM10020255_000990 [Rhodococcus baikonurensis]